MPEGYCLIETLDRSSFPYVGLGRYIRYDSLIRVQTSRFPPTRSTSDGVESV